MTVEEAAYEIWEPLGETTDLSFTDADGNVDETSAGWRRLVRAINRGLVATMRYRRRRDGRRVRWPGSTRYVSRKVSGTTSMTTIAGSTTTAVIVAAGSLGVDAYLGWSCEIGEETKTVAANDGTTLYLSEALESAPAAGTAVVLRQTYVLLDDPEVVVRVTSTSNGNDLTLVRPESVAWEASMTYGAPVSYYQVGKKVFVTPVPEEEEWLRVEVEAYPSVVGLADEELPIPHVLHDAVVLWCLGWGMRRYVNAEMMTVYRREFEAAIDSLQLPEDAILERADDRFGIEMT